ncbi:fatty acid-binding protein, brain-like [Neoarius graeffei]|uniref:fatty acid-binding protein, brain-like n=1 Tax=Neoarius graeffei TaxID=443677 RepID=UPI00298D046D|nr:fatty acid-binding protein, brain-like [Neoarius graeffei]
MDAFFGSWKLVKRENYNVILAVCGTEEEVIQLADVVKPVITFSQDGDSLVYTVDHVILKTRTKFRFGEEFYEEVFPGRFCRSTMKLEGEKLIHVRLYQGFEFTTVREIQDGILIATITHEDITAVQTYEKV